MRVTAFPKEASHSLPLWVGAIVAVWQYVPIGTLRTLTLLFLWAGLVGGVLLDIPTHSEERYRETDCTFLWPLGPLFRMFGGSGVIRWPNDRWEYRLGHGILRPLKAFECTFNWYLIGCFVGTFIGGWLAS